MLGRVRRKALARSTKVIPSTIKFLFIIRKLIHLNPVNDGS